MGLCEGNSLPLTMNPKHKTTSDLGPWQKYTYIPSNEMFILPLNIFCQKLNYPLRTINIKSQLICLEMGTKTFK